jgi:hypothetical protein
MSRLLAFAIALVIIVSPRSARAREGDEPPALELLPSDDAAPPPGAVIVNATDEDVFNPADDPPPPSCCCCGGHLGHGRRAALIMGLSLIGTGFTLSLAHAATVSDPGIRQVELIPVGGAIYAETRSGVPPSWSAALMFAAWSQAMGVLVLAVALGPEEPR